MHKDEFNLKTIEEQVNYINSMLPNQSLDSVCNEIGLSRRTIAKRFLNANYSYINKQYIKSGEKVPTEIKSETVVTKIESEIPKEVINKNSILKEVKNKSIPLDAGLQELLNYKDILIEIAQQYKCNNKSETIVINEACTGLAVTKGMKTYVRVIEEFDQFCANNRVFKKQDLLAMALIEYIQKYSKK